ncbi:MAG: thiopeptide-type bacteriocin biosynthesis protein [Mangrovibacterium sp.]
MKTQVQRKFIIGDEWFYLKIYSGPKTLESLLIDDIYDILQISIKQKIVDKFFFVRYTDPDYHLRLRFHLPEVSLLLKIVRPINKVLSPYIDNRLVWTVCTDTYNRELERYGFNTITEVETFFSIDSLMVMNYLKEIRGLENNFMRWLWCLRSIDMILVSFRLSLPEKRDFTEIAKKNYEHEFSMNKLMKIQLDGKYRNSMAQIQLSMDATDKNDLPGFDHLIGYFQNSNFIIEKILDYYKKGELIIPLNNLIASLVHMHINRLFRTKQPMQEFVIFYFLDKYYKSQIMRQKSIANAPFSSL